MGGALSCVCGRSLLNINGTKYIFQENLGEGGFSYVDLLEDSKSGQFVALKRIVCHDKKAELDALQEAEYCRRFQHDNILPLIDHCVREKQKLSEVWLVFPFYKHGTLYDEYQRLSSTNQTMSCERLLNIFHGVCKAIQVLHDHEPAIAHRDIKPANVLLSNDDTAIVMDLGSAAVARVEVKSFKEAQAIQDLAAERCTMPYRAPELFHVPLNSIIDEKVDIWSLGCVLFSLMYLEGPFDKVWLKKDSVALAVQNKQLPFPAHDKYPPALRELVCGLVGLEPSERPNIRWTINEVEKLLPNHLVHV